MGSFVASVVNGGLGYGYSSVLVPLLLLVVPAASVVPYVNLVECFLNPYVLWSNRGFLPGGVWGVAWRMLVGLVPGVLVGGLLLGVLDGRVVRGVVYGVLIPLGVAQLLGFRWPVRGAWLSFVGFVVGVLYGLTTISGPLLALFFVNQGLARGEFRAALGVVRTVESWLAAVWYWWLGLSGPHLFDLNLLFLLAPVVPGVWLGRRLVDGVGVEGFRRAVLGFDVVLAGVGLVRTVL
ncbi:protein of unknown function DUF81 [Pyrobaculum islandicum DSM 4184]|uniref:Probable membrane transporter protein n=1 Tax=Pyrobaculum islandicum (strain DSM 4184 / JCM 9189 / GEO3) TaxID=384616 RepID=A1RUN2_PYRIL|nr:protein of unknown function DUF81 [Pyrobaculum islandicum DSM 4184]